MTSERDWHRPLIYALAEPIPESVKISRTFRRFHAHGLIAKIPHTRRWRVTHFGRRVMGIAIYLRDQDFPQAHAAIAA